MYYWFTGLSPVVQALLATLFTWFLTALGAAVVFLAKNPSQKILDGMLGMAAGVMIAASYWSLLAPAIEMAEESPWPVWAPGWFPATLGFLLGGAFLWLVDLVLPHLHLGEKEPEGVSTTWRRTTLLILAITLHNFPEGLAVGVAFGAVAVDPEAATIGAAIALAIGIGLQNFPEGTAVSMPLRREKFSRLKSFYYGQLSAVVEPIAGVLGASLVLVARPVLPYALAFAAGAMIYVVVEELIPEAQRSGESQDLATVGAMAGFAVMMTLDVALG